MHRPGGARRDPVEPRLRGGQAAFAAGDEHRPGAGRRDGADVGPVGDRDGEPAGAVVEPGAGEPVAQRGAGALLDHRRGGLVGQPDVDLPGGQAEVALQGGPHAGGEVGVRGFHRRRFGMADGRDESDGGGEQGRAAECG